MNLKLFAQDTILYGIGNASLRAAAFLLIPLYTHALPEPRCAHNHCDIQLQPLPS